jgi:hypothetical protein
MPTVVAATVAANPLPVIGCGSRRVTPAGAIVLRKEQPTPRFALASIFVLGGVAATRRGRAGWDVVALCP